MAGTARRRKGEDSIFLDEGRGKWTGVIDLGYTNGKRERVTLRARLLKDDKKTGEKGLETLLREKHAELSKGVRTPGNYTFAKCVEDWFAYADRKGKISASSLRTYRSISKNIIAAIGPMLITDLRPVDVQDALDDLADRLSTTSIKLNRNVAVWSLHRAQFNQYVSQNVAVLTEAPRGTPGRPSRALTLEQSVQLLMTARSHRLWSYVALSLLGGVRTEEARALRWTEVDFESGTVSVYRADRVGGDTKTPTSRRRLEQAQVVMASLKEQQLAQARDRVKAGAAWRESDLVFTTTIGTAWHPNNLRDEFKDLTEAAGLGRDWVPREMRHTFVSVMSAAGVPLEQIADLVGHAGGSRTTESVYRHQIVPVLRTGAAVMDKIFEGKLGSQA